MGRSFGSGSSGGSRSFGSASRSFGGSRSFGSGSFGGSRSFGSGSRGSRSFGSGSHRPTFRWRPHTTVVFGRSVYYGAGRSVAANIFTILLYLAFVPVIILSGLWYTYQSDMDVIADAYYEFHQVAVNADNNPDRQITAEVLSMYEYEDSGKYYLTYYFYAEDPDTGYNERVDGTTFYIYDYETASQYYSEGQIVLAIDSRVADFNSEVKTIPLDHKDMELKDDAEYAELMGPRNLYRALDIVVICLGVVGIVGSLVTSLTAKQATKEQLAESDGTKTSSANGWRCAYCNTLNDNDKNECSGCGASR